MVVELARRKNKRIDQLSNAKAISYTEKAEATTDAPRAELQLQQALERRMIARL